MGSHPLDHATGLEPRASIPLVSGTQCIDVPWHDSPLLTIIPQSGPGTETFSAPAGRIPDPEEDGRKFARDGMIFPA